MMVLLVLGLGVTAILAVLVVRRSVIVAIPCAGSAGGLSDFSSTPLAFCALSLVGALLILAISAAYWRRQTPVPVILQASRGARSYAGDVMLAKMIEAAEAMYPQISICLYQAHGNDEGTWHRLHFWAHD